jgi:signal transduction histidine kinase
MDPTTMALANRYRQVLADLLGLACEIQPSGEIVVNFQGFTMLINNYGPR